MRDSRIVVDGYLRNTIFDVTTCCFRNNMRITIVSCLQSPVTSHVPLFHLFFRCIYFCDLFASMASLPPTVECLQSNLTFSADNTAKEISSVILPLLLGHCILYSSRILQNDLF